MARSRVDHDRPFTLRILAALVLTGLYYGLVLGLSARLFLIVMRSGPTYWLTVPAGGLAAGSALAWCSLAWIWVRAGRAAEFHEIKATDVPVLHQLVRETASELRVRCPDQIYISQRANGFSVFWGVLGFNVQWTGMGFGLPVLAVLTPQQLKGLIGHELGHMQSLRDRSGDGWYMWAAYNYWSCAETLNRSSVMMRLTCPQIWYAYLMTNLTWPVACQEELTADACAVRAVPPEDHGAALEGIALAQEMFREFLEVEVRGLLDLGICPRNIFEGFRQHVQRLTESDRESLLARYHERDARRAFTTGLGHDHAAESFEMPEYGIMPESRWCPHPLLERRLEHLKDLAPDGASYRAARATTATRVPAGIELLLTDLVLEPLLSSRPGVRWRCVPWVNFAEPAGTGAAAPAARTTTRTRAATRPTTETRIAAVAAEELEFVGSLGAPSGQK